MSDKIGIDWKEVGKGPKFIIYALHYDASDRLYIGRSSSGLRRPRRHGSPSNLKNHPNLPIVRWIRKHQNVGERYQITILEACLTKINLLEAEKFHIAYWKSLGVRLLNVTDGGDGHLGYSPSFETRARLAAAQPFRPPMSVEDRARIGAQNKNPPADVRYLIGTANRGKRFSLEVRARMSAGQRASMTPERRAKLSASARKRPPVSEVTRNKLTVAKRGRTLSTEVRTKIADTLRQLPKEVRDRITEAKRASITDDYRRRMSEIARARPPMSQETRSKIAAANTGRKHTAESRAKMSVSKKASITPEFRARVAETNRQRATSRRQSMAVMK